MQLGFVSAILPEQSLEEVFSIADRIGYDCVEVMCWPVGEADRRYAGVTHINVNELSEERVADIGRLQEQYGVSISGLGYYPNPLAPDAKERTAYAEHLRRVMQAAQRLGVGVVNTFVGRDPAHSVADNWPHFRKVWPDLVAYAEQHDVRIGIENCPMLFTDDEWPGGKNLATTPAIWRDMFNRIPSAHFGLNYDPSHLIWQHMDYLAPLRQFTDRLVHVHAKDVRVDRHLLDQHGIMAPPNLWHSPKLPGLGQVDWGQFFSVLSSVGYTGPVCVEVEDRAYEGSLERRIAALRQSHTYLRQFMG